MKILEAEGIGVSFGGVRALQDVSCAMKTGEITSIVGPNGAGKTTLFNVISGVYRADAGRIRMAGADVTGAPAHKLAQLGLSRTFQNLQVFFRMTAIENVMVGLHLHEKTSWLSDLLGLASVARQNAESRRAAEALLEQVGLAHRADEIAANLAYGELKRLEIGRALATRPKLLLLDEPAAGCNGAETNEIAQLVRDIRASGVTVVLVEHDMGLVMEVSDHIFVLDQGRRLAEGTPEEIRNDPAVIAAYLGAHGAQPPARPHAAG